MLCSKCIISGAASSIGGWEESIYFLLERNLNSVGIAGSFCSRFSSSLAKLPWRPGPFHLILDTFQRPETPWLDLEEMPQETEADSLTWVPEDQAGKNHHVKFSLHFPLSNCSCFAWEKKKFSQIREAKTRKEMCLHGGGKSQWRALPPIELFGEVLHQCPFVCFLRKKGLWLPLFFFM